MKKEIKKIVVAYSGGLDTSVMLRWFKETYQCQVVAFTADIGQEEELSGLKEKALLTGADDFYVADLKEEFAKDFVFPALAGGAVYEDNYLLGTSVARPVIAKKQIEIAADVGADAVAHGATGKGNDQVRFEFGYYALNPNIQVIAPWREWPFKSRTDLLHYAKQHEIPVTAAADKMYSMDRNLMHISYEGGILEDPWIEPPHDLFILTKNPEDAPDKGKTIELAFEKGHCVSIDRNKGTPGKILHDLNELAGEHGVGRIDIVENRFVGIKSRGVYETPGATVLHQALRGLESIVLDREVLHLRQSLSLKFAELIYNGYWFSPEFSLIRSSMDQIAQRLTGTVRVKLYKGHCYLLGRKSDLTLYSPELATFEEDSVYEHKNAEGFIKISALRLSHYGTK